MLTCAPLTVGLPCMQHEQAPEHVLLVIRGLG